jgi:hypothetical protein
MISMGAKLAGTGLLRSRNVVEGRASGSIAAVVQSEANPSPCSRSPLTRAKSERLLHAMLAEWEGFSSMPYDKSCESSHLASFSFIFFLLCEVSIVS